jgi:hypothetical protein
MSQFHYKNPSAFSARIVSVDQAIRLLHRNSIQVNREQAKIILDFLYLIAKTFKTQKGHDGYREFEPKE